MIRFGPSGNDSQFYADGYTTSVDAPEWLTKLGLSAFEISFGRGIIITEKTAREIGKHAKKHGIEISVHAPYFINLANDEAFEKNLNYIKQSLDAVRWFGGNRIVVHCASESQLGREVALKKTKTNLRKIMMHLEKELKYDDYLLCLETMGRYKQIGDHKEIAQLCTIHPRLIPCIDFGHMNCLAQGAIETESDFSKIFKECEVICGEEKMKYAHIHFSKIRFNEKGEMNHLTFENQDFGPPYEPFINVLCQRRFSGTVICESRGSQARDALRMRTLYKRIKIMTN